MVYIIFFSVRKDTLQCFFKPNFLDKSPYSIDEFCKSIL